MRNPPLYIRLSTFDLRKSIPKLTIKAYMPAYQPPAGTRSISLEPENPKANWTPEHHLAHHLMGMDYHKRNTSGPGGDPTKSSEYQTHLKGAHQAIQGGAEIGKVTAQHYAEAKTAFPQHIRSNLGKANPGLYIGG